MSFLLACPHCGPRPVDEYAYFGEVTRRPERSENGSPSLRELTDYVYFRDNVAGVAARVVAAPHGLRRVVPRRARHADERGALDVELPSRAAGPPVRLRAPQRRRADRPRPAASSSVRREADRGYEGDTIGSALYAAGLSDVFSRTFKYHRHARPALLHRPLPELHDDRGRRAERPRLRRAAARGRAVSTRRTSGASLDLDVLSRHRQGRRAVHAGRLLLPDDDPAAAGVAALREGAAQPRRARSRRRARRALAALRRRAPPRARARRSAAAGRPRGRARPRRPQGQASCSSTRARAARRTCAGVEVLAPGTRARHLRGRARPRRLPGPCSTASAPSGSSSRPARSSSRSCSPATTSSA